MYVSRRCFLFLVIAVSGAIPLFARAIWTSASRGNGLARRNLQHLHQNPSSPRRKGISALIAAELRKLGYGVTSSSASTMRRSVSTESSAFSLTAPDQLLLRTDMSLPIVEKRVALRQQSARETPDGSEVGVMHACATMST